MTEGRCEDTTESSLRGVLTVHSYWVGAQTLWQVNYRIRMSGRGTGVDTFPQVNSMIRMYTFYVCIGGSHWGSHMGSHGGSHVSLGFL